MPAEPASPAGAYASPAGASASPAGAPACLILQPIHPGGPELLQRAGLCLVQPPAPQPHDVVAVITRDAPVDAGFIAAHPALRVIAKHGAGLDAIAVAQAEARGIRVVATPGLNAQSVAEHALMLMLALARRLPEMQAAARQGDATARTRIAQRELHGARLGLVGFGQVGQRLAALVQGFAMRVQAFSPSVPDAIFTRAGVLRSASLPALLAESDIVSLHLPARAGTRGLIGAPELGLLPRGAILINVGRGGVLDESAAAAARARGQLGGLGLDVMAREPIDPAHELLRLDNVIVTPHVAGSSAGALEAMSRHAAQLVLQALGKFAVTERHVSIGLNGSERHVGEDRAAAIS